MSETDTSTNAVDETQRAERVEEASERMRDMMEALDKIAHEAGLARSAWLAEVRENLDGLTDRYDDWTDQFSDDFAAEPAYVDPKPWECQPCGYRFATEEGASPVAGRNHEGVPVYNPRTTRPE